MGSEKLSWLASVCASLASVGLGQVHRAGTGKLNMTLEGVSFIVFLHTVLVLVTCCRETCVGDRRLYYYFAELTDLQGCLDARASVGCPG